MADLWQDCFRLSQICLRNSVYDFRCGYVPCFQRQSGSCEVLIESFTASVIFMILPKEVGNFIAPVFSHEKNASLGETLRKNVVMRLDFASKAINNVKNDVNGVSDRLKRLYSPTLDMVCDNVKEKCLFRLWIKSLLSR